jgi:hypothetical protein
MNALLTPLSFIWFEQGENNLRVSIMNFEFRRSVSNSVFSIANFSHSENLMVAVGFIPRMGARTPMRRGATLEYPVFRILQSSLLDEEFENIPNNV